MTIVLIFMGWDTSESFFAVMNFCNLCIFLITLQSGTGTTTDQVQGNFFFFSDCNFETLNDMNLLILFYPCMS